tara:strand:- start:519 stop:686 length:168 start_codon:yes stop_codon:yes gene_type:complete
MMKKESAERALNELVNSGKIYPEDIAPVREYISSLENPPKPAPLPANKAKKLGRK